MANGIDPQYTGIGRVPIVQEETTSVWDAIVPLAQMAKADKARQEKLKLDYAKLHQQGRANDDLKDYREKTLDQEAEAARALDVYRQEQNRIAQQNADTNAAKQLSDAEFQEDTIFLNTLSGLSQDLKDQEILTNPAFMKRQGINPKEVMDRRGRHADFVQDQVRAKSFQGSNNPLQLKYHMKKLQENDLYQSSKAAQDIVSTLGAQILEANEFQKDLFRVEPKEIAAAYTQYPENLKTIAGKYMPQMDLTNVNSDVLYQMMQSQKKFIPPKQMDAFNREVEVLTNAWANKYRMDRGIGTYDESDQTTPVSDIKMTPDDYTLTDERFQLIEKAMEENNPLWEKWLYEEDYGFEDLKVDYEAGLKADDAGATGTTGTTGTAGATGTTGATGGGDEGLTPEQQKAIYAQGLKDNPFLTKEQTLEEFLPEEEPKQAEAFLDPDLGWITSTGDKANAGQIAEAKKLGQKAVTKDLTANQKRKIKTRLSRIKNIQNMNYSEGEKVRRIRAIQNDILAIDPNYDFTEAQTLVSK